MSLIVKSEGQKLAPIPEGTHFARCVQLIDLGSQYSETYDKWSPKVMIRWEIPGEVFTDTDGKPYPRLIGSTYTKSLGENANMRKMLEAWRGKKFTDEELKSFDLSVLVSLPCMITITHSSKGDTTYANVANVAAMPKGIEIEAQATPSLIYDLDSFDALENIDQLPEFIQNIIKKSKEWDALHGEPAETVNDMPCMEETADDRPF